MENTKKKSLRYSPEVRERAVRMVLEHQGDHESQWKGIASIAAKFGCSGETLRSWVRKAERDRGLRPGESTQEQDRLKELEREVRELRAQQDGLIHHSDRGVQYVSIRYTDRPVDAGIEPSVGSVGDSYDNALAETINGLCKAEVIHRLGPWRNLRAVEMATLEWVDWFNNRRLFGPIVDISPAEAEAACYEQLAGSAIGA
ncbi:transposase [Paraburkholderia sp. RL17-373-BIF-A]|uniref:transposase n=1 Tax=Paraburkholderia sp. RL17-373-BIF-A TaxID=3031629 RepID=UPI0038BD6B28